MGPFTCTYAEWGCKVECQRADKKEHERGCAFVPFACAYAARGCNEECTRTEKGKHEQTCIFAPIKCNESNCDMAFYTTDEHVAHSVNIHKRMIDPNRLNNQRTLTPRLSAISRSPVSHVHFFFWNTHVFQLVTTRILELVYTQVIIHHIEQAPLIKVNISTNVRNGNKLMYTTYAIPVRAYSDKPVAMTSLVMPLMDYIAYGDGIMDVGPTFTIRLKQEGAPPVRVPGPVIVVRPDDVAPPARVPGPVIVVRPAHVAPPVPVPGPVIVVRPAHVAPPVPVPVPVPVVVVRPAPFSPLLEPPSAYEDSGNEESGNEESGNEESGNEDSGNEYSDTEDSGIEYGGNEYGGNEYSW
jgi:hypothetical protein